MFKRTLLTHFKQLAKKYPIVTLLGPRQSGKTTLAKAAFPNKPYVNMEEADNRELATTDPKSFLEDYPNGAILDEIQRTPHLLSYLQVIVDEKGKNDLFILTGSHQAELHTAVSQSLAGRTSILRLLPLSYDELKEAKVKLPLEQIILQGGYPRIYKEELPLMNAYGSYFRTYVERDVRQLLNIKDILSFERFIKLLAGRVGQLINYSSLAADVGVSSTTIKEWIAVLEATYIIVRLKPYFENFGKRLIKSPKIYFVDTGLICYLLNIESKEQLIQDSLFGNIFENWVMLELMKIRYHKALEPHFYFYRDISGKEIDLLIQQGSSLLPVEIKSSKTFSSNMLKNLDFFQEETSKSKNGFLIYRGAKTQTIKQCKLLTPENFTKEIFA